MVKDSNANNQSTQPLERERERERERGDKTKNNWSPKRYYCRKSVESLYWAPEPK